MSGPSRKTTREVTVIVDNATMASLAADTAVILNNNFTGVAGALGYSFNMAKIECMLYGLGNGVTRAEIRTALMTPLVLTGGTTSIAAVESALDGTQNWAGFDESSTLGEDQADEKVLKQRKAVTVIWPELVMQNNPSAGATYDVIIRWSYIGPPLRNIRSGEKRDWVFGEQDGWTWHLVNLDQGEANDASWLLDGNIVAVGKWF